MNPNTTVTSIRRALMVILAALPLHLSADPPGPPAGPPGDTMKSLQELWDKMELLETQNAALQEQLNAIQGVVRVEMVTVGDAGNFADTTGVPNPAGAVAYEYKIGKYEVTNAQYAAFLNAVAAADSNNLFNTNMGSNARGGITRSGTSPNFSYAVNAFMGDKPVNYVSWYDCLRFCNWLHNGQPSGAQDATTTEDGAYTLTGTNSIQTPGSDPTHGANGRNAGARFHLPSEDEWYKAAYHEPGASTNSYWLYPTRSDTAPTVATADAFGNIDNDAANIANYNFGADWNGENGNVTTVGSGGPGSASYYDAFDMGGNVWEWNEQNISGSRGLRGGSWVFVSGLLRSSFRNGGNPSLEVDSYGFRVAGP